MPIQARPRHQQHHQPVPGRQAGLQQRDDLLVAGPVDRLLRLMHPVPGPHPPRHARVLAAGLQRQVQVVGQLIQLRQHLLRRLACGDRVHQEPAYRRQHRVDPAGAACRGPPRAGQHLPIAGWACVHAADLPGRVPQPGHEQPEVRRSRPPVAARPAAPPQEQRDPARVRLARRLRAIAPEPHLPQERVRLGHHGQVLIQHRPVLHPGRHPHRERPHRSPSLSRQTTSATRATH